MTGGTATREGVHVPRRSIHRTTKVFDEGSVEDAARARIRMALQDFDRHVVSFSGGKDSTCVLNLVVEEAEALGQLPVRVVFYDEEAIGSHTVDYCDRIRNDPRIDLEWYCLPVKHRNACTSAMGESWWYPWGPEDEAKWCRPMPDFALTALGDLDFTDPEQRRTIPELNPWLGQPGERTALYMGIRADESVTRRHAVTVASRRYAWLINPEGHHGWIQKVYPIYDWRTSDVWAAPALHGWDYNEYYDILEMAGVAHHAQRCAPPFGDEPIRLLHAWQETYPELWDKMVDRVPGAAAAARYALTELWGVGADSRIELGPGECPQDRIKAVIMSHDDPAMRAAVVERVRYEIELHYRKTNTPIVLNAKNPDSGLSWRLLQRIARTGDLKMRMRAMMVPGYSEALKRRYDDELAALQEQGVTWLHKTSR